MQMVSRIHTNVHAVIHRNGDHFLHSLLGYVLHTRPCKLLKVRTYVPSSSPTENGSYTVPYIVPSVSHSLSRSVTGEHLEPSFVAGQL